ncbi:hypothetical protein [Xylocopilactobacillus apis]|uniref:Lipoprotein n=1 Tax=Xylocopilactobacillus apis TaxID=2932183 RepID=A0AAU9DMT5_9LACO|nr:hypothetical protein [Xylocopilactobacillus apis]BDR56989.1 lipoprotein [Xylocopilactobacillus apis]
MKNKKPLIVVAILSMLMILTGCGASSKQALINHYDEMSNQKSAKATFKMKVTDFDIPVKGSGDSSSAKQLIDVVKASSITGDIYSDGKNGKGTIKLNTMNKTVPLEFVGNDKNIYMGADFYNSLFQLMSSFGMTPPKYDFSKLAGKYVDLIALMNESSSVKSKVSSDQKEAATKAVNKSQQDSSAVLKEIIDTLPKDAVTKKDGVITATLHKEDVKKTIEIYNKYIKDHKDVDAKPIKQKDIDEFMSEFKAFDIIIKYDSKASTLNYTLTVEPKDGGKIGFEFDTKSEKYDGKIEMPSKDKIVSPTEFTNQMNAITGGH